MTIKELERLYHAGRWTEELQEQCRSDSRTGVRKLVHRWERETQERARVEAMYHYEFLAREKGCTLVAGVDEAGRGPLAGPVVVAAVILPLGLFLPHLNDSKKLSAAVREELFSAIMKSAVAVEIVSISEKIIDERNIYQATKQGMYEAVSALRPQPQHVLLDAVPLKLPMTSSPIVHGDAKSASIAAASIAAKVTRDRLMLKYDEEYPQYGFKKHKGYGTAEHLAALQEYGSCPIHRRSFEPIRSMAARY
ncbi:ribonuclease HII [uncultured Selenomonas sp.]|uniref:ribonuclease HII n=1 Tax=uncultured Selenomonas sp. TaxID=159275 RepID=UPI0026205BB8|nr:ribonuclease HII [uncultured Selenomonas sp.]